MVAPYPVQLVASPPARFERAQVLVRLALLAALGVVHQTASGVLCVLYLLMPVIIAVSVSSPSHSQRTFDRDGWLARFMSWAIGVYAYFAYVSDGFPLPAEPCTARVELRPAAPPTPIEALTRWLTTLPHAFALVLLGLFVTVLSIVASVLVLSGRSLPPSIWRFQRASVAWLARVFAYHVCLVREYPPFALHLASRDDGPGARGSGGQGLPA